MELARIEFTVSQAGVEPSPAEATIADSLVRKSNRVLPEWSHAGRPALTQLFETLRTKLNEDAWSFAAADTCTCTETQLCSSTVQYTPLFNKSGHFLLWPQTSARACSWASGSSRIRF